MNDLVTREDHVDRGPSPWRSGQRARRVRFWVRRYLPAEIAGTLVLFGFSWIAAGLGGGPVVIAYAATIGESIGFYLVLGALVWREVQLTSPQAGKTAQRTMLLLVAECGPAEVLDVLVTRPLLLVVSMGLLADGWDLLIGKLAADAIFYLTAGVCFTLTVKLGLRRGHRADEPDGSVVAGLRARRRDELAALLDREDVRDAIASAGTPLLLLDLDRLRQQYRRLAAAFPGVRFHYAVKALAHPAVIEVLRDEGSCFDIASLEELALVSATGVDADRVICTHPIKTIDEIKEMHTQGVRRFVVDNAAELTKFDGMGSDARILIRLAYTNPGAGCDLSSKFGVDAAQAELLVEQALRQGTVVEGFSFHVGSQLSDPTPFRSAVRQTLDLMDVLETRFSVRFQTLDIGGGIPAAYDHEVVDLEQVADAMMPLINERAGDLDVLAEPGRIMVADTMTLVTRVVGVADRPGSRWYYLDDGLYGSYSNVLTEGVHPLVLSESEVRGVPPTARATLAGPTCDSTDVIGKSMPVPDLQVGDLMLSPTMGAYTSVTASRFNGRALTPIITLGEHPRSLVGCSLASSKN